ncbi:hypothetical protein DV738_g3541, partial [Chaetothyriales sp. CBS 135597]
MRTLPVPALTDNDLVDRLEEQRQNFTRGLFALTTNQQTNLKRYSSLVDLRRVTRNTAKRRVQIFVQDVWNYDPQVYLLCAISTTMQELRSFHSQTYLMSLTLNQFEVQNLATDMEASAGNSHVDTNTLRYEDPIDARTLDFRDIEQVLTTRPPDHPSDQYLLSREDVLLCIHEIDRIENAEIHLTVPHASTTLAFITIPVAIQSIKPLIEGKPEQHNQQMPVA